MNISVTAPDFDTLGHALIDPLPTSEYGLMRRRASKVQTLDGGVAVNDFGYSDGDREFVLRFRADSSMDARIKHMVEYYALVNVSTKDGFYTAIPQYEPGNQSSTLTLSITSKVA